MMTSFKKVTLELFYTVVLLYGCSTVFWQYKTFQKEKKPFFVKSKIYILQVLANYRS